MKEFSGKSKCKKGTTGYSLELRLSSCKEVVVIWPQRRVEKEFSRTHTKSKWGFTGMEYGE